MALRPLVSVLGLIAVAGFSLGCSSSDDAENQNLTVDPKTGLKFCDPAKRTSEPCVDDKGAVLCLANSGYDGDDLAMCNPDPSRGMLLHYGPENYDDRAEVSKYTLAAGGEEENCIIAHTPNTERVYTKAYNGRMRPNSHHLIVTVLGQDQPDSNGPVPCAIGSQVGTRWLLGSQDPQIDVSVAGAGPDPEPGEPDYHLGQIVEPNTPIRFDMHYINSTSQEILKEGWVFLEYAEPDEVDTMVDMITFFQGEISVPPRGSSETKRAACTAPTRRNVGLITGHFHQNGTRFSVWKRDLQ